jgi:tetratricopeptide (TPR) repeat protein
VSPEKITYLLEKLDLPMNKLPEMLEKEQEELKKIKFKLLTISTLLTIDIPDEALERLNELNLEDNHPLAAHAYYLKGKCHVARHKWKQAERALFNALRVCQQNSYHDNNMEAASYLLLSFISYYKNDLEQAIAYVDNGINAFHPEGGSRHVKALLYRNKGIFLQRLGRVTEGMRLIQEIWDEIPTMDDIITVLSFYWLRAEFSRLSGMYEEAIQIAEKGIDLAQRNKQFDSMCDLWTTLGSVHTSLRNFEEAETCFRMALKMENKFPPDQRLTTVYTRLGYLHIKQERYDDAHKALEKAIRYAEKFNDAPRLITSLRMMGDLCHLTGKTNEAIPHYEKALSLAHKHGFHDLEFKLWLNLARCWDGVDEKEFQNCMRNMYLSKKEILDLEVELNEKYT